MKINSKKIIALFEIFLIINMSLAFSFLMNVSFVSANSAAPAPTSTSVETAAEITAENDLEYGSPLSNFLKAGEPGMFMDSALSSLMYAALALGAVELVSGFIGIKDGEKKALQGALAAGVGTYKFLDVARQGMLKNVADGNGVLSKVVNNPLPVGIAVGALVFYLLYEKEEVKEVRFQCLPWQAPLGGENCELCNDDLEPCSLYRCKSLGQACELINVGTDQEKCVWMNPDDASSPGIKPWKEELTPGYEYSNVIERPPGGGSKPGQMEIISQGGLCLKAFTPMQFGIITSEPAQCKIAYNHTDTYDEMEYYLGDNNLFQTNHTQKLSLPSPSAINSEYPEIQNSGKYTLLIRCTDANGNVNRDEFSVRFCIDDGPDVTPPQIVTTSLINNMPVSFGNDELDISVYTNEPANCKWSRKDADYDNMENTMTCSNKLWEMNHELLYACNTKLTGIEDRKDNDFYFRCKDVSESENPMRQSYKFTVKGTQPLDILKISPNETVSGSTSTISVNLNVETDNGYNAGESTCYYSETGGESSYIEFYETKSRIHNQNLDLISGDYEYFIKCVDLGGNTAYNKTQFKVDVDRTAPMIIRAYNENDRVKIKTNEESSCTYSTTTCNFEFDKGIQMVASGQGIEKDRVHYTEWIPSQRYYIKCADKYNNQPNPSDCSIVIKPFKTED